MSNTLYLECFSGISGDMTVASLLDLGADEQVLRDVLDSIKDKGFKTIITHKKVAALDVCDFDVVLDVDNHDHDMDYLFPEHEHHHEHEHHDHNHSHEHDHHHDHDHHDHEHNQHHHHHHEHRNLAGVFEIIDSANMTDNARRIAKDIFNVLAKAEAKAHGVDASEVHFHEVGALDSIVDIISVAVCVDNLNITDCIVPVVYEGSGFVRCQHGDMPIPVPAVTNICTEHGIRLHKTDMEAELVTPTGAAILAALRTSDVMPRSYTIKASGLGAGKRQYKRPSILRAMLIEPDYEGLNCDSDEIYKLESNIDDSNAETLGFCMERLLEAGAKDVFYIPCYMKKNRPSYILNVICDKQQISLMESIIFNETTTIGIRRIAMERSVLKREEIMVRTSLGDVRVKSVILPNGDKRFYPEYESIAKICRDAEKSYTEVYTKIMKEI